jgi:ABC-type transport system involved in multi-copper enzyme maturation permease subunit
MIWIAWRYQRSVACTLALLALVVIAFAIIEGIIQHHDFAQFISAPCRGNQLAGHGDYCGFLNVKYSQIQSFDPYVRAAGFIIAPLVGAILGLLALTNELDHRTVRLAWTQSISRSKWLAAKSGVGAISVAVILVPTAVVLSWWSGNIGDNTPFGRETFAVAGWVLVAYGLFMFALTLLVGVVIRRVGWTLAVAISLFLGVAVVVPQKVREHLVPTTVRWTSPAYTATIITGQSYTQAFPNDAWLLVNGPVPRTTKGTPTNADVLNTEMRVSTCISGHLPKNESERQSAQKDCYRSLNLENASVYIGTNEFWTLQLREGLLYLVSGLILTGGTWALVRRIEP